MYTRLALPCLAALLAVSACSADAGTGTTTGTSSAAGTASSAAGPLTVSDPWIKAVKGGMTGIFATLRNDTDQDIRVVKASSPIADHGELHLTVKDASGAMVMKETKDGFVVPKHGAFELRPGANHIMLMGLTKPVLSGETVPITLETDAGAKIEISAPAREFNGAQETYGGMSMTPNQGAPTSMTPAPTSAG
ncbi:copper chaperone PCu(A)C [Arsenicicoccus dermatophilus]|uniref:copper chaperone PCu(A)C n=1 Tax=Arsenicicoccus dermatophilus TaxID=1076331 RepID=UPI001F4CDB9D|nr:copper chaperone PCu(A)C [Arsenicicoccus dermatophilus]MCH8614348.1 copper chaperone PCu(A)C [Arsenicicoccus dermatophilus]